MHPAAIGPFRIERELGRGGMGEVYLARDTRLDRQVAIKALPAHLAEDPDRLARFQREAKVLASLNHPGIAAIYGLEEAGGHQYLVLEFVEGETLGDRLTRGPIPIEEALLLARQIAEALEAAHEKGVIHRDLKPGNVMVTPDGAVKVLDFGLARTADGTPSTSGPALADSPTITSPARFAHSPTIPGVIMGTAGYMSPEQARGKPVDRRSDIFSFGCVLYEMLTGIMPFQGETVADAIGATLHKESDLSLLPPRTPRRVRELLGNCLAKEKKNRLHDIGDARLELERTIGGREWAHTSEAAGARRASPLAAVGAACALTLLAGGIGWFLAGRLTPTAPTATTQTYHVSTTVPASPAFRSLVGISPDSTFLVCAAWPTLEPESTKPEGVLVVRRLDRDETLILEGTEGARNAALSPDGRTLAFACARDRAGTRFTLKKLALEKGQPASRPESVCDLPTGSWFRLGWASDREIIFTSELGLVIYSVPTSGGDPREILRQEASDRIEGWDNFRPANDGQSILATHYTFDGDKLKANIEAIGLASGKRSVVLPDALSPLVAGPGKDHAPLLLAIRSDQAGVVAVRYDPASLRTIGDPVGVWSGGDVSEFDLASSGTLAITSRHTDASDRRLAWIDEHGQPQVIPGQTRAFSSISVSPDGNRVLFSLEQSSVNDFHPELWVQDLARRTSARIPIQGIPNGLLWNVNGQRITHAMLLKEEFAVWDRPISGPGEAVRIFSIPISRQEFPMPTSWSPDGKILAIIQQSPSRNNSDVLMLEQQAGSQTWTATPYLNSPADEHALQFSPDGKWVVFCSVESGRHELYAQRFTGAASGARDAASGRVQVSTSGHDGACWWSPDGKEIRFVDGEKQVVSVDVKFEPTFSASIPKTLYSIKDLKIQTFSWSPDGRLMVVLRGENENPTRIDLVVNFLDELRAKIQSSK